MSTLRMRVNGVEYENFKSAMAQRDLDAISSSFEFSPVVTKTNPMPFARGDICEVIADGIRVLNGFIEGIDVDYDPRSHDIFIFGRSKTCDLVDSSIDKLEIKAPITLRQIIEKVIDHIGADIKVINNAGDIKPFEKAEDLITPEIGENCFRFIEAAARKRQVLLTDDGDGNVVMTNAGVDSAPQAIQNVIGSNNNNIKAASISYDDTEQFNRYIVKSQLNPTANNFAGATSNKTLVDQKAAAIINPSIRTSRQLVIEAENASSGDECKKRAKWESNIRASRSVIYSTTLTEFSFKGRLWDVNQIAKIKDDFARVNSNMLTNSIRYVVDGGGTLLNVSFVDQDSYKPDPIPEKTGKVVGDWTGSYR